LAVLPLAVSCQSSGRAAVTRSQAEKTLKMLVFPKTRVELAQQFPDVGLAKDPPVFSIYSKTSDREYCHLGDDVYLVMRVEYKQRAIPRPYLAGHNPVQRGNRRGSMVITPDQTEHRTILKARPDALDIVHEVRIESGVDDYSLELYRQYKHAEATALTSGS
jgi:hypothetical protein